MSSFLRNRIPLAGTTTFVTAGALFLFLSLPAMCLAQLPTPKSTPVPSAIPAASNNAEAESPEKHAQQISAQTLAAFILNHDRVKAGHGFLKATQIDPRYAPAWFNLGVLSEGDKDWSKSKGYFKEYLRLAPAGPDATRAKKELQLLSSYAAGAITPETAKHEEYDATIQRSRAFLASGFFREGIAEAGRAQAADSSRWEAYAVVALCMAKQHKQAEAVKFQDMAVNHAPIGKREQVQEALAKQMAEWIR